ncbi:hypothetical protein C2E31_23240 [Rhodopirellula baltica]|nr:hypothetical protein C2E31_23240 [Rhodopirellula baltica]
MRYMKSHLYAVCLILGILNANANAQLGPASYRSLEDTVHNAEVVLLGRILAIDGEREQLGQSTFKIRFDVKEVIKSGDNVHESFYLFAKRKQIETWIETQALLVLKSPFDRQTGSENALVTIDFNHPELMRLSLGEEGVLAQVTSEPEILAVLRRAAQRLPGVVQMRTFQLPTEADFVKQANLVIQDGLPVVFVPIDKPLETWAKRVIAGETELPVECGTRALRHFKSKTNIEWIRKALQSNGNQESRELLTELLEEWSR